MFYNTAIYFQCFITGSNFIRIERIDRRKRILYRDINIFTYIMPFDTMYRIEVRMIFRTIKGDTRFITYNHIHTFAIN